MFIKVQMVKIKIRKSCASYFFGRLLNRRKRHNVCQKKEKEREKKKKN